MNSSAATDFEMVLPDVGTTAAGGDEMEDDPSRRSCWSSNSSVVPDDDATATHFNTMDRHRITALRTLLSHKPKNARAMAQLACLLASNASSPKSKPQDSAPVAESEEEAMMWVELSISTAPSKPFGYAALSMIHDDSERRIQALQMAIERCSNNERYHVAAIGLLVRLLVESHEHPVSRNQQQPHGQLYTYHQNRLNTHGEEIHEQIDNLLSGTWKDRAKELESASREFLALREYRLGRFFRKLEPADVCRARSASYFEAALQHLPTHNHPYVTLSQFWLTTLGKNRCFIISQCPAAYVVGLYSTFASRFDNLLVSKLDYKTPTILRQLHDQSLLHGTQRSGYNSIADLGCGTGLSGLAFASLLKLPNNGENYGRMVGVDLSPEMLLLSEKRGCYNKLVKGDITSILTTPAAWDFVLACDVFCYIGDLSNIFSMVHSSLTEDGIFAFSTEKMKDSRAPFQLHECARFAHSEVYIENLALETNFQVVTKRVCPIRKNKGEDVIGLMMILRKAAKQHSLCLSNDRASSVLPQAV
jgi:predicted TPR repeat methyltransferase